MAITPMPLKFAVLSSNIELPFFVSLASHKINHDKLETSARRVLGCYEVRPDDEPSASCRLQMHGNSLVADDVPTGFYRAEGVIRNVNTIEEYRRLDKLLVLQRAGCMIWDAIRDGSIFECPSLLASFSMICFADLKKYQFTYLFAFPALHPHVRWKIVTESPEEEDAAAFGERLDNEDGSAVFETVQTWRYQVDARQYGFFLLKRRKAGNRDSGFRSHYVWEAESLRGYETGFFQGSPPEDCFICFADPSTYPRYPGWMLRNLLVLIQVRWKMRHVQILCYRDSQASRHDSKSVILKIAWDAPVGLIPTIGVQGSSDPPEVPKITGWERNASGKVTSKIAKLGEYMDPRRLADQAVDLNLKLMKWRIAPNLDLECIKNAKCLLLGAGTLGCYVARSLLGWGVRNITFVDNGNVSFSNPVRQPLFNFEDCLAGGMKKALQAAKAIRGINPGVEAHGHVLSIPMIGHPILDESKTKTDFETLEKLIKNHDVILLLMDTRESRWLPTVLGKSQGKLVMNAAVGFDSFVVMRHGQMNQAHPESELGCYFCNDIVAPANSTVDRTLDQQCTVTRPGVAAISAGILVELMVSVLQQQQLEAAAAASNRSEDIENPLGNVPHQLRGFLSSFSNLIVTGQSYPNCSACSRKITSAYSEGGWDFIKQALGEEGYIEDVSGLAEIQRAAEKAADEIEWDEDENDIAAGFDELNIAKE